MVAELPAVVQTLFPVPGVGVAGGAGSAGEEKKEEVTKSKM
jgi:hypothetical protein